ncbi:dynamin family protein [Riemerella anatipestifer]|uniref:dynamin family protein n=1 Tax=Riemerella anatipestifer TaxID=34085 RepID=UPI0030BE80B0
MEQNLFQKIQNKRGQMKLFVMAARERNWIGEKSYQDIIKKIDEDTLTIGVIGQMKCGKSTFLNSFLFEEEVLPAATTPMTAALSVITYGESKSIRAEFYSPKEWEELRMQAEREVSEAEGDKATESKIKAAKELVEKASKLGSSVADLLGKIQEDKFENLIEYVGADGKYIAITKSVTIFYPKEWLKGVEVVDTPGFNDPVVSREERTQEFLKRADVVLMLLYAGRAFDATDRDIVFEKVRRVGVGKILIGVNKYDLCYSNGETVEEIVENVETEIQKACREYQDPVITELLENAKPIPFSANMALMSKMPLERIRTDENLSFHWKNICDDFEISTQKEMFEKSLVTNLEEAIKSMIEQSKDEILFRKPINMILQAGENIKSKIASELIERTELLKISEQPDDEIEEKIDTFTKVKRKIERKINNLTEDLSYDYDKTSEKVIESLEDYIKDERNKILNQIDISTRGNVERNVIVAIGDFEDKFHRLLKKEGRKFENLICNKANEISNDVAEILTKYIEDSEDLIASFETKVRQIQISLVGSEEENEENYDEQEKNETNLLKDVGDFLFGLTIVPVAIDYLMLKDEYRDAVTKYFISISLEPIEVNLLKQKEICLNKFEDIAKSNILTELIKQLEIFKNEKSDWEQNINKLKVEIESLKDKNKIVDSQMSEMKLLKENL